MRVATLVVVLLVCTGRAAAADCAGSTQRDLDRCASAEYSSADKALNSTYTSIIGRLRADAPARSKLVAAQRAWLAFRDAECEFAASGVAGGSIAPMIVTNCRADLTKRRQTQLAAYLSCQQGDTSCPVPAQ
jgi:uncharacterized protein YecT (DUF1311 family)